MEPVRVPPSPAVRRWSREHGFSAELVARWGAFYEDLPALLAAMQAPAPVFLRMNPLRGDPDETRRRLVEKGFVLDPSGIADTWRVAEQPFSAGATDEYLLGRYTLQDVGSALAPLALEARPGEAVADLCAAPGGKTIQLAGLTGDAAALFAFDADAQRARALVSNLNRCGVTSAAVYAWPGQRAAELGLPFDRVLLDAPCTGEGVVARDPRRRKGQLGEYAACAREQASLLEAASGVLRPGGVLVYSTCTLAPEENEVQVVDAVQRLGLEPERLPPAVRDAQVGGHPLAPGLARVGDRELPDWASWSAHALPHRNGCLGFFVARLRKPEAA